MALNTVYALLTRISVNISRRVLIVPPQGHGFSRYLWAPLGACTYWLRLFKAVTGQISGSHMAGYWAGHDRSTGHDWAPLTNGKTW